MATCPNCQDTLTAPHFLCLRCWPDAGVGPVARNTDPETSHEAAEMATRSANRGRLVALKSLYDGPKTDFELEEHTGWQQNSIGKRRGELCRMGLVTVLRDTQGAKVKRPTPSGARALVWAITDTGKTALLSGLIPSPRAASGVVITEIEVGDGGYTQAQAHEIRAILRLDPDASHEAVVTTLQRLTPFL